MDLRNQPRKAELKPSLASRRLIDHAGTESADAERRLRRKMRIYPDEFASLVTTGAEDRQPPSAGLRFPVGGRAAARLRNPGSPAVRKAIVSIHGRDVRDDAEIEDYECGHLTSRADD